MMVSMILYSCFMFLMFLVFLFSAVIFFYFDMELVSEWVLCSVESTMVEILILLDWMSMLFVSFVLLISSMVILYSIGYMEGDKNLDRFMKLVVLFVVSMLLMVLSPSLVSILFGWDLLGLVSYCLVIYYQNYSAYNSGMVTVLSNRVGDVGLLMAIGLSVSLGSWNVMMLKNEYILGMLIMGAALTKSAQMPFSTWLPMAMAAPTPVSSLVHSSTLVTAGVYLIIRFYNLIMDSEVNFILMFVSMSTMIMSGLMANFEFDLKKIIALSTLSQLGFMMMILSFGAELLGLFHLLTHAVFKSLLFMSAGCVIHVFKGSQDIRYYGNLSSGVPFLMVSFIIPILSLVGFPFMAGFYSKDMIMEMIYIMEVNMVLMVLIVLSISLTIMYSLRLCYYFLCRDSKFMVMVMNGEGGAMNFSMIVLMNMSVFSGALLNWVFYFDFGGIYLSKDLKSMMVILFLGVIFFWVSMIKVKLILAKKSLEFLFSMWYLNYFYISINKYCLQGSSNIYMIDLSWVENLEGSLFFSMKYMLMKIYYSVFKIYNVIFSQVFIFLMLVFFVMVIFV